MRHLTKILAGQPVHSARVVLLCAGLMASGAARADGFGNRHVLVIGIDGCRPDALQAANAPNLKTLATNGTVSYNSFAGGVQGTSSQQATLSGPGWSSILTGTWIDKHMVSNNTFSGYDAVAAPHIFKRIKEHNPQAYLSSIVEWSSIDTHLVGPVASYTDFRQLAVIDDTFDLAGKAARHLTNADPDVLFIAFDAVDYAGHWQGGFSASNPNYLAAIAEVDTAVGMILAAVSQRPRFINESWLVMAVTDHGGTGILHGGQSSAERTIFVIANGLGVPRRTVSPGPGHTCVPATVLEFLGVPIRPEWGWASGSFGVPPRLHVQQTSNQLQLSWFAPGYTLQNSTNLALPSGWTAISGVTNGASYPTASHAHRFFRLAQP